jgi:hypothetical protein
MKRDLRDHLVMTIVTGAWVISTWFLWEHPTDVNFATWAGFGATMTGTYHWLNLRDDKEKDA